MALEYIANEDYTLEAQAAGAWIPGTPTETRITAPKADCPDGKAILVQQIGYIYSTGPNACALTGYNFLGGAGVILASSQKVKCNSLAVMRENDSGNCVGSFQQGTTIVPCSCTLKIDAAGQTKVMAQ